MVIKYVNHSPLFIEFRLVFVSPQQLSTAGVRLQQTSALIISNFVSFNETKSL